MTAATTATESRENRTVPRAAPREIEVIGVSPALVGALAAFDLPVEVTVTDTRGRRWPG